MSGHGYVVSPVLVRHALDRMRSGDGSEEVFSILVEAAEEYSCMREEWGIESPIPVAGLVYVTQNDMLIETMSLARPEAHVLYRLAPSWRLAVKLKATEKGTDQ